jgi:hypothetical protein
MCNASGADGWCELNVEPPRRECEHDKSMLKKPHGRVVGSTAMAGLKVGRGGTTAANLCGLRSAQSHSLRALLRNTPQTASGPDSVPCYRDRRQITGYFRILANSPPTPAAEAVTARGRLLQDAAIDIKDTLLALP